MENPKILWFGEFSDKVKEMMRSEAPDGFDLLFVRSKSDREEHLRVLAEADYISPNGILLTDEYILAAPKLKLIQCWGAGMDAFHLELLQERNIALQSGAGLNASAVAEMAVLHMLALNRRLLYVDRTVRSGRWIKSEMRDQCRSIYGKTIGLLGMGNIARKAAGYLKAMDAGRILYYDIRRLSPEQEAELGVEFQELDDVVKQADILSIHLPLTERTKKLINRERLAMMKPDSILINTARGGIVDEEALIDALENHRIRGAGLDTFAQEPPAADNPLFAMDNVVVTSHGGGAVVENILPRIRHVYDCIVKFERGEPADPNYVVLKRRDACSS